MVELKRGASRHIEFEKIHPRHAVRAQVKT
jgi:hypothetical protein